MRAQNGSIANAPAQLQDDGLLSPADLIPDPRHHRLPYTRDFRSNLSALCCGIPIRLPKSSYPLCKFCSAFIVLAHRLTIGFGFSSARGCRGQSCPGKVRSGWRLDLRVYLVYLLSNAAALRLLIFAVVALSRNIYASFSITIVLLFFVQMLYVGSLFCRHGKPAPWLPSLDPFVAE